eukprot:jgi/Bigna1/67436/fgenesh1_pg.3_\
MRRRPFYQESGASETSGSLAAHEHTEEKPPPQKRQRFIRPSSSYTSDGELVQSHNSAAENFADGENPVPKQKVLPSRLNKPEDEADSELPAELQEGRIQATSDLRPHHAERQAPSLVKYEATRKPEPSPRLKASQQQHLSSSGGEQQPAGAPPLPPPPPPPPPSPSIEILTIDDIEEALKLYKFPRVLSSLEAVSKILAKQARVCKESYNNAMRSVPCLQCNEKISIIQDGDQNNPYGTSRHTTEHVLDHLLNHCAVFLALPECKILEELRANKAQRKTQHKTPRHAFVGGGGDGSRVVDPPGLLHRRAAALRGGVDYILHSSSSASSSSSKREATAPHQVKTEISGGLSSLSLPPPPSSSSSSSTILQQQQQQHHLPPSPKMMLLRHPRDNPRYKQLISRAAAAAAAAEGELQPLHSPQLSFKTKQYDYNVSLTLFFDFSMGAMSFVDSGIVKYIVSNLRATESILEKVQERRESVQLPSAAATTTLIGDEGGGAGGAASAKSQFTKIRVVTSGVLHLACPVSTSNEDEDPCLQLEDEISSIMRQLHRISNYVCLKLEHRNEGRRLVVRKENITPEIEASFIRESNSLTNTAIEALKHYGSSRLIGSLKSCFTFIRHIYT